MNLVRSQPESRLLPLREVERRLPAIGRRSLGVQTIPLADVVGTEGRQATFTRDFAPRHESSRQRIRALAAAFPNGEFPPIVAVKLGDVYFVIDGHHRVALARQNGGEMIDADITELVTRVPLPAGADMVEVVLRQLERVFLEDGGLAQARPGVRLAASRPALYLELLENMQVHGYHLMRDHGRVLSTEDIADDWYENVLSPAVAPSVRESVPESFKDLPDADLFLLLHQRRREGFPSGDCPPLADVVASLADPKRRRVMSLRQRRARLQLPA
ncbi:MAG: ParB N-terminal domain-containing protein [Gaiellaceae bacterium]